MMVVEVEANKMPGNGVRKNEINGLNVLIIFLLLFKLRLARPLRER